MSSLRRALIAALVVFAAATTWVVDAAPAGAHGDEGVIDIDTPEDRGDLTVGLLVRVTFENDDEPVTEDEIGDITVAGTGPGGETVGPESGFEPTEVPGVYSAELTVPTAGSWDLTVSSVEPEASGTVTVVVADPDAAPVEADDPQDDEGSTDGTVVAEPVDGATGSGEIVERGSGGDGPTTLLVTLLVAGALVVAGVAGAVVLRRRGRSG